MRAPPLLLVVTLVLAGCVEQVSCAEHPDHAACEPWVCCTDPTIEGCEVAEVAARCGPDGGGDAGPDATPDGGGDAGPCGMACAGATPVCDEASGACVQCTAADASACTGATALCDTAMNLCVACLGDGDCADPAMPICAAGACRGCGADTECETMGATPVCDETSGRCVECTVDTETSTCPAPDNRACHPVDLTCTGAERGTLGFCQGCVSDSECITDGMGALRCVPMTFGSPAAPHGTYCARDLESYRAAIAMPAAPCPDRMVTPRMERSVLGVETTYCFIRETVTTCEAVLGFGDLCPGGDADCGATGLDDASCQAGRCTYECGASSDCFTGLCAGGGPTYCQ